MKSIGPAPEIKIIVSLEVMDDVWEEEGPAPSSTTRVEREHHNSGYVEGITASKEKWLQPGFDGGYPTGAVLGMQVGQIIGTLQGLGLRDIETKATSDLSIENIYSSKYWDKDANPTFDGTHPLIEEWNAKVQALTGSSQGSQQSQQTPAQASPVVEKTPAKYDF